MNVLFIGNSQVRVCNLPRMLETLSASAPSDRPRIDSSAVAQGGRTLRLHWEAGDGPGTARTIMAEGHCDWVIIQEIYRADRDEFETYASRFADAARAARARPLLFATAHVTEHYRPGTRFPDAFYALNDMQIALGQRLDIPVAAAGYAWLRYLGYNPMQSDLFDLYGADRGHPGIKGTYIYACLLYAILTARSPLGLTHALDGYDTVLGADQATRMQRAAWEEAQSPYALGMPP